jgi:hypothetical protein
MKKKYFVIHRHDGGLITGEHISDLNPKMIDALHDIGGVIKNITFEEFQQIHMNDNENKVRHFYNYN